MSVLPAQEPIPQEGGPRKPGTYFWRNDFIFFIIIFGPEWPLCFHGQWLRSSKNWFRVFPANHPVRQWLSPRKFSRVRKLTPNWKPGFAFLALVEPVVRFIFGRSERWKSRGPGSDPFAVELPSYSTNRILYQPRLKHHVTPGASGSGPLRPLRVPCRLRRLRKSGCDHVQNENRNTTLPCRDLRSI